MFSASDPPLRGRLSLVDERRMAAGGPLSGRGPMVWLASALVLLVLASGACSPQPGTSLTPTQTTPTGGEAPPRPATNPTGTAQASPSFSAARLGFEVRGWT